MNLKPKASKLNWDNMDAQPQQKHNADRTLVAVQGLGFVGLAMAVAVADARDESGHPWFDVVGVELDNNRGRAIARAVNSGLLPIQAQDPNLQAAFDRVTAQGNLTAATDPEVYGRAGVVVVDLPLDLSSGNGAGPSVNFEPFLEGLRTVARAARPGTLIVIETTVPPGTCAHIAAPEVDKILEQRGLPAGSLLLAHSYERVMPGRDYYNSIVNYWRVYAGHTTRAADACHEFLSKIINTKDFPLTRLSSTTASETAKVLENSYRAANIAFMEEWGRFAESTGVDLFEVIDAVRLRPTHNNIRQPGFGVGGYCLTKDPLFALAAARQIFGRDDLDFGFCRQAVGLNRDMPLVTLARVRDLLGGSLSGRTVLLCGISYRPDVGDTRFSPSETFVRAARQEGAAVICHDPLVEYWTEMDLTPIPELPGPEGLDAVVFAVGHDQYQGLDLDEWLAGSEAVIFDANNVLTARQRRQLEARRARFAGIGRGTAPNPAPRMEA